jgi:hypothetical protein
MPSGRAKFNRPATTAARLTGKAPSIQSPITDPSIRQDIAKRVRELRSNDRRRQPDDQDFRNLVEELISAIDWVWGQLCGLNEALTASDKIAEYEIVLRSLKHSITCLRMMSLGVDLSLGHGFDGQGIADDAEALAKRFVDTRARLEQVLSSRSPGKISRKASSISERSRIADELASRIAQSIEEAGLKVTASPHSPAVRLVKFIGELAKLSFDESTWRDKLNAASRERRKKPRRKKPRKKPSRK